MADRVGALVEALDLQVGVVDRVEVGQLALPSRCAGWTVREVLDHSLGVTRKLTEFALGATDEPHAPPGDLVGGDHRAALRRAADDARSAWASADMARSCRLPFGTFPADLAAGINLFDVLAHTWDVAAAVGIDLDPTLDLWSAGLDAAREVIGRDRGAHYGPRSCSRDLRRRWCPSSPSSGAPRPEQAVAHRPSSAVRYREACAPRGPHVDVDLTLLRI